MKLTKNQQAWLNLLRSDSFAQGVGALKQVDKDGLETYCCLGVGCVALGVELEPMGKRTTGSIKEQIFHLSDVFGFPEYGYVSLPPKIALKLKITKFDQQQLITSNDIVRDDFNTIANQIEEIWRVKFDAKELAKSLKKQQISTGSDFPETQNT